jgi:hypothetical protein
MNIYQRIKKLFKVLLISTALIGISGCAFEIEKVEDQPLDQRMQDISKRAVYAIFGCEALQVYDVDSNVNYQSLCDLSPEERVYYTAPFSDTTFYKITYFFMLAIVSIVFLTSGTYSVYLVFSAIFASMSSGGEFMGSRTNSMFFFLKHMIVFTLLAVTTPPYNVGQMQFFKMLGYSNVIANKMNTALISNQPRTFPSLKIPAADSKDLESAKLIQFMSCVKSDPSVKATEIVLNFYKDGGLVKAQSSYANCNINFSLGLDTETTEILKQSKEISDLIDMKVDFEEVQFAIQKKILERIIKRADKIADVMLFDIDSLREEPELFNQYLIKTKSNSALVENWEYSCGDILNYKPPKKMIKFEKEQYLYLASRCLSHNIVESLVYPTEINNFSKYLRTDNYLNDNNIQLCDHDYNDIRVSDKTIIAESTEETDAINQTVKRASLKDCLVQACSSLKSEKSNAFLCANTISLFDKAHRNDIMEKNGFIASGAYIYTLFSNSKVSETAKNLLNNFDIQFSKQGINIDTPSKEDIVFTINHPFKVNQDKNLSYVLFNVDSMSLRAHEKTFAKVEAINPDAFNTSRTGFDLWGSNRFITCSRYPMRIIDGYSCASIPEETNKFGRNLFTYSIYLKTMITSFKIAHGFAKKTQKIADKRSKKKNENRVFNSKGEKFLSSFKSYAAKYIPSALGYAGAFLLVENNFGGTQIKTDEFGDFNNEKYKSIMSDPMIFKSNLGAFLIAASGDNLIADMLNLVVNFFMFIGLFFAYVIPLVPVYLWLLVMIGWMTTIVSTLVIIPVWLPSLLKTGESHANGLMISGAKILFTAIFKAPLYLLGLILAWITTNYFSGMLMSMLNFADAMNTNAGLDLSSLITSLIVLVLYCVCYYMLVSKMFAMIEGFEESANSWIIGDINAITTSKDRIQGLYGKTKNTGKLLKS